MRRASAARSALLLVLLVACQDAGQSTGSAGTQVPAPAASSVPPATAAPVAPSAPSSGASSSPSTSPAAISPPERSSWDVVLVPEDDTLALREAPGADAPRITGLPPDAGRLTATGRSARVGSSDWWEISSDVGRGWVNARYLTAHVTDDEFAGDERVRARTDEFTEIVEASGDLTPVVSRRGLHAAKFSPVMPFAAQDLPTALDDDEEQAFGGPECSPEECGSTFREFAQICAENAQDPLTSWTYDRPVGGTSALHAVEYQPPAELVNYHYLAALTPIDATSDHPWTACYWFFAYEQDRPVVVGLTFDAPGI